MCVEKLCHALIFYSESFKSMNLPFFGAGWPEGVGRVSVPVAEEGNVEEDDEEEDEGGTWGEVGSREAVGLFGWPLVAALVPRFVDVDVDVEVRFSNIDMDEEGSSSLCGARGGDTSGFARVVGVPGAAFFRASFKFRSRAAVKDNRVPLSSSSELESRFKSIHFFALGGVMGVPVLELPDPRSKNTLPWATWPPRELASESNLRFLTPDTTVDMSFIGAGGDLTRSASSRMDRSRASGSSAPRLGDPGTNCPDTGSYPMRRIISAGNESVPLVGVSMKWMR